MHVFAVVLLLLLVLPLRVGDIDAMITCIHVFCDDAVILGVVDVIIAMLLWFVVVVVAVLLSVRLVSLLSLFLVLC